MSVLFLRGDRLEIKEIIIGLIFKGFFYVFKDIFYKFKYYKVFKNFNIVLIF